MFFVIVSGYLSSKLSPQDSFLLVDFLCPSNAFMQYLFKSASEQIYLEVTTEILPPHIQLASDDQLPPVFKERLITRSTAANNASFMSQPSSRSESARYLKCTLIEYFLLYFVYYATLPTVADTPLGTLRKAVSLVSYSVSGLASSMTPPVNPNSWTASIHGSSIYASVFLQLLDYFFPWKHSSAPVFNGAAPAQVKPSIFDCYYLDRNTQLQLSKFFFDVICETWLSQNDYSVIIPHLANSVTFTAPSRDLLNLVLTLEEHILAMNIPVALQSVSRKRSSFEELSLYSPIDWMQGFCFKSFAFYLYRAIRIFLHFPTLVPFDISSRLLKSWLSPAIHPAEVRNYVFENLFFYTVLFDEYLGILTNRLPLNSVLLQLTSAAHTSVIAESNISELLFLKSLLATAFTPHNVDSLVLCEKILLSLLHHEVDLPRDRLDEVSFYAPRIQETFSQYEAPISVGYTNVIGSLAGGGGKLLKRLYHLEIFMEHIQSVTNSNQNKKSTSFWSMLFAEEYRGPQNIKAHIEVVKNCCDLLEVPFFGHDETKSAWKKEAAELVTDASSADNQSPEQFLFLNPETKNHRLTNRGKQQILKGEQKCTNRDLKMPRWNPSDTSRITASEIKSLVMITVALGYSLNQLFQGIVTRASAKIGRDIPDSFTGSIDFCYLRWFANRNNLLFTLLTVCVYSLMRYIFRLVF